MDFNPEIHHRKSYRLKGYDYSKEGLYFVTICTKDRVCSFGKIENDKMILNDIGNMANECWLEIPRHFSNVVLHKHIVMPNHVHGVIELNVAVGTSHVMSLPGNNDAPVCTRHVVYIRNNNAHPKQNQFSNPIPGSVSVIIQQFKSSVKRWCNKNQHKEFRWQSRFHDHIIRNDESYQRIVDYISNNPFHWKKDKLFK